MLQLLAAKAEKIHRLRNRTSNTKMDLMKLYGIFCVAFAHCFTYGFRVSSHLNVSSIYVIQLFMFCSGYFYRTDTDHAGVRTYFKKCSKAYLLPYFTWNLIYGALLTALRLCGVVNYGSGVTLYSFFVRPWLDGEQYVYNTPSWFLPALFLVAMITWGLRKLLSWGTSLGKRGDYLLLAGLMAVGIAAVFLLGEEYHAGLKVGFLRPLVLLPYYQLGIVYKKYWEGDDRKKKLLAAAVLLVIQVALPLINGGALKTSMIYGYFSGNPLLLVVCAVTAVLLIAVVCDLLSPLFVKIRAAGFLSRNTMYMMLHHLFVLFLIQLGIFALNRYIPLPDYDASRFRDSIWYCYTFGKAGLRYLYVAVALVLPAILHWGYETVILKLAEQAGRRNNK